MKQLKKIISFGILIEIILLLFMFLNFSKENNVLKYIIAHSVVFILVYVLFVKLKSSIISKRAVFSIILISMIFQFTLLFSPPGMSDDIYRYVWDGKLQYEGINPYRYAPSDLALNPYHTDQLPSLINFPRIKTIYPPVSQFFFLLSYSVFGSSVFGMKFFLILISVLSMIFFTQFLNLFGVEKRYLLFYSWNPLLVMETAVNGHIDILMALFLILFIIFFFKKKYILSSLFLSLSILTKLWSLFLIVPIIVWLMRGREFSVLKKFIFPVLPILILFYLPYITYAANMFRTALNYSSYWFFNNPLFYFILKILKDNTLAHRIFFSLFLVVLGYLSLSHKTDLKKKIYFSALFFIILNPTLHPWYLIILLALIPLHQGKTVIFWSLTVVFSYIVLYLTIVTGVWADSWWIMSIEYFPLLSLVLYNTFRDKLFSAQIK